MRLHPTTCRLRRFHSLAAFVLCAFLFISYIYLKSRPSYSFYKSLADEEVEQSRQLIKDDTGSKYVLFKQLRGAGFNNQVQEILLFHHLALLTSRIYVYQPIVWRPRGHQSFVPLSAFLQYVTRSGVSISVFDETCSPQETMHVSLQIDHVTRWENAKQVLKGPEKCIIVDDWVFDWTYLSSPALQAIWPSFQNYLSETFQWSHVIDTIASRAYAKLDLLPGGGGSGNPYLALHLRRGDFEEHCHDLASDHEGFTTWATLPILQESITPPTLDPANSTSVLAHCYPSLERILSAVDEHARAKPHLRAVHVLHDGAWDHPLVYVQHYRLEAALKSAKRARTAGWKNGPMQRVTHSGNVPLGWGEADWAVAVDVELARRAEVFVGNGFSSLSTQVVALRLGADGGRIKDITLL